MKVLSTLVGLIATDYQITVLQGEEFIAGLIYGLIGKDDLPELQKCLKDSEKLDQEISEAIADFSKGDFQDVLKGVEVIGEIIKELPQDLQDCGDIQDDVAKIEQWAAQFANPITLVTKLTTNLLKNWSQVAQEVNKTETDFKDSDFYDAGDDVAEIVVLSLGKITHATEEQIDALAALNEHLFVY